MSTLGIYKELLHKSINPAYLLYMLLLLALNIVASIVVVIPLIVVLLIIYLIGALFFAFLKLNFIGIFIYLLLGLLALALIFLAVAVLSAFAFGLMINFAKQHLSAKKLSLDSALQNVKENFINSVRAFFVLSVVMSFFLILIAITFLLFFLAIFNLSDPLTSAINALLAILVFILVYFLAIIFTAPFFTLYLQFPFFASTGVKVSLENAIKSGKENYWKLFKLYFINFVFLLAIVIIFFVILSILTVMSMSLISAIQSPEGLAEVSTKLSQADIYSNIFSLIFSIWGMSINSLVLVTMYNTAVHKGAISLQTSLPPKRQGKTLVRKKFSYKKPTKKLKTSR